jgi:hypothetical protein
MLDIFKRLREQLFNFGHIRDKDAIEDYSVSDRYLNILDELEENPVVVVHSQLGHGKTWEVARVVQYWQLELHRLAIAPTSMRSETWESLTGWLSQILYQQGIQFTYRNENLTMVVNNLAISLNEKKFLICFEDFDLVQDEYREEFIRFLLLLGNRLENTDSRIIITSQTPVAELVNHQLRDLTEEEIATWLCRHVPVPWDIQQAQLKGLTDLWLRRGLGNYFLMDKLIEYGISETSNTEELYDYFYHADNCDRWLKSIWDFEDVAFRRLLEGIWITQQVSSTLDCEVVSTLVPRSDRDRALQYFNGLKEGGYVESTGLRPEILKIVEDQISSPSNEDILAVADALKAKRRYIEVCELYFKTHDYEQIVELLSTYSLVIRRRGQSRRAINILNDVSLRDLQEAINKIRLYRIKAEFLDWFGDRQKDTLGIVEDGLKLLRQKNIEFRNDHLSEWGKLLTRRGVLSARMQNYSNAIDWLEAALQICQEDLRKVQKLPNPDESERLAIIEQMNVLYHNLGLAYLNTALKAKASKKPRTDGEEYAKKAWERLNLGIELTENEMLVASKDDRAYLDSLSANLKLALARYYEQWTKDLDSAKVQYVEGIKKLEELGLYGDVVDYTNDLAVCLAEYEDFEEAREYAISSLQLAEKLGYTDGVTTACATLSYDVYLVQAEDAIDSMREKLLEQAVLYYEKCRDWVISSGKAGTQSSEVLGFWIDIIPEFIDRRDYLQDDLNIIESKFDSLRTPRPSLSETISIQEINQVIENVKGAKVNKEVLSREAYSFKLQISKSQDNNFEVRTFKTPQGGESHGESEFPFSSTELLAVLKLLDHQDYDPSEFYPKQIEILRGLGLLTDTGDLIDEWMRPIGQRLYESLFPSEVGTNFKWTIGQAQEKRNPISLQLRFDSDAVELARYPWELLHDGMHNKDRYNAPHLLPSGLVELVRYITFSQPPTQLNVLPPWKLLYIGARPKNLEKLPNESERQAVFESLRTLTSTGKLTVNQLDPPTFDALQKEDLTEYHFLHFDGHGTFAKCCPKCRKMNYPHLNICAFCKRSLDDVEPSGYLAFETQDRNCDFVPASDMETLLTMSKVRLAFLSACQSAVVRGRGIFGGLAPVFIRAGVPAVVAMQFSMPVNDAIEFAEGFYKALAEQAVLTPATITQAVAEGRRWLFRSGTWFIPTLYLRSTEND